MKLVYNIGINDADYVTETREVIGYTDDGKRIRKIIWSCPFHSRWKDMLKRCYSTSFQLKQPTYIGCSVSNEWLYFSKFKAWMEQQDWEGKDLDKDILVKGNKIYSSEACVFVERAVNMFIVEPKRGKWPTGVSFEKDSGKYKAQCNSSVGKTELLGRYTTPEDAHKAWLDYKLEQAHILASQQKDKRIAKALVDRYESYAL